MTLDSARAKRPSTANSIFKSRVKKENPQQQQVSLPCILDFIMSIY
ncbi:hypothetical protein GNF10_21120 [Nostoc sp. UCD121]|nr:MULTISPECIES: hypothetical protein [unclassified Nostoc]MBC1220041.1 hypothetical protein [Nostoc sp. UCD120]MBC1278396.1 hypothetical protein [Nostoc sp. UCD121]MBC1295307.1 hypothetical protein [Nostoc sp. UCD122]